MTWFRTFVWRWIKQNKIAIPEQYSKTRIDDLSNLDKETLEKMYEDYKKYFEKLNILNRIPKKIMTYGRFRYTLSSRYCAPKMKKEKLKLKSIQLIERKDTQSDVWHYREPRFGKVYEKKKMGKTRGFRSGRI